MRKVIVSLIALCVLAVNAAPKYSGEISAEFRNPGYANTRFDSIADGAQLVCSFETADIVASHTVDLSIRARKADGKYTGWKNASYNPDINYDYTEPTIETQAVDRNILRAVAGHEIYDKNSAKKVSEKTVAISLPSFDDVTDTIVQYEIKIKYTNDCTRSGRCH